MQNNENMAAPKDDEYQHAEDHVGRQNKPYHHGDLRAALIAAGLALLAEDGLEALSLRAAARRAGVSHNAPYRHFADKEGLLAAIAEDGFARLAQQVEDASARFPTSPRQQLEDAAAAYVQFAVAHPDQLRIMFGGALHDSQRYPELAQTSARAFNALMTIIQQGQEAGAMLLGDSHLYTLGAWAQVHGLATLLIDRQVARLGGIHSTSEELARQCSRLLYQGLGMTKP